MAVLVQRIQVDMLAIANFLAIFLEALLSPFASTNRIASLHFNYWREYRVVRKIKANSSITPLDSRNFSHYFHYELL